MRRRPPGRFPHALLVSAGLHAALLGLAAVTGAGAEPAPRPRVFRVDIVSPPPNRAGEPAPAAPAAGTVAPEPEPEASQPPAGGPETVATEEPPAREEPEPGPSPVKAPTPPPVREKPRTAPTRRPDNPLERPRPGATPSTRRSDRPQETAKTAGAKQSEGPAAREAVAATGRNPDPNSPGGEGLAVRTEGAEFSDPAYLGNIIRQLRRYFRPPPGATSDEAEVHFWIARDGTVSDIRIKRSRGSFQFRAAAMEAVEQAGIAKAFGPLPRAYPGNRLPVAFTFEPAS